MVWYICANARWIVQTNSKDISDKSYKINEGYMDTGGVTIIITEEQSSNPEIHQLAWLCGYVTSKSCTKFNVSSNIALVSVF